MATLTSSNLVQVGISMVLEDRFSSSAGQVTDSFRRMYQDIRTAAQATKDAYDFPLRVLQTGINQGIEAYRSYAEVGRDVFLTASMAGNPLEYLDQRLEYLKDFLDSAKNLNLRVPLTTADVSSAQKFMAMAGMSRDMIMQVQEPVAKLASIFRMDAGGKGGVADIMTNIMATFQMGGEKAKELGDNILIATTRSNMNLRDLGDAIKYSGAEMMTAGISFQEGAAAIGLLGDMGIQGSSAGTAIANTLRYLRLSISGQKTKGSDALKALGLSRNDFLDAKGNLYGLHHMYTTVAKAIRDRGLTNDEVGTAFYNIFGVRGSRNMLPIIQQLANGTDKMSQVLAEMKTQQGILDETTDKLMQTDPGQIDKLRSNVDYLKITMGQVLSRSFLPILQVTNKVLEGINQIADSELGAFLIRGGFKLTMIAVLSLVRRMVMHFNVVYQEMRAGAAALASGGTSLAASSNVFRKNIELALHSMMLMNLMSSSMANNSRYIVGAMNGAPIYMGKNKKGVTYLSYTNDKGTKSRLTNPSKIHSFMMAGGMGVTKGGGTGGPGPVPKPNPKAGPLPYIPSVLPGKWGAKLSAKLGMGKLAGGIGKLGLKVAGLSIPILNAAMMLWLLYDVGSLLVGAIRSNTDAQKKREAQEQAKAEREAREQARKEALKSMSWEDYIKTQNASLSALFNQLRGPDGKPIGQVNIIVNGQNIAKIASDEAIDVTSAMLGSMNNGLQSNLNNQGF